MSPPSQWQRLDSESFPRVSGDEPFAAYADGGIWGVFPA